MTLRKYDPWCVSNDYRCRGNLFPSEHRSSLVNLFPLQVRLKVSICDLMVSHPAAASLADLHPRKGGGAEAGDGGGSLTRRFSSTTINNPHFNFLQFRWRSENGFRIVVMFETSQRPYTTCEFSYSELVSSTFRIYFNDVERERYPKNPRLPFGYLFYYQVRVYQELQL